MKTVFSWVLGTLTATGMLMGCGGSQCPQAPPCPVCQTRPAPTGPTGPTSDNWHDPQTRILFTTGGAELSDENRSMLDQAVETLRGRTDIIRVQVIGHTDTRGRDSTNEQLSMQRAQAVVSYLVSKGMPQSMLEAVGRGSEDPVVVEAGHAENRAQNRRVEFRVLIREPIGN